MITNKDSCRHIAIYDDREEDDGKENKAGNKVVWKIYCMPNRKRQYIKETSCYCSVDL